MVVLQELRLVDGKWIWELVDELNYKSCRKAKKDETKVRKNPRQRIRFV
jgi:hypothetical protein